VIKIKKDVKVVRTIRCTSDEKIFWEDEAKEFNCKIIWQLNGYSFNPPMCFWKGTMIQSAKYNEDDEE